MTTQPRQSPEGLFTGAGQKGREGTPPLPQDPQEVQLRAGSMFGQLGVYISATGGHGFIPAHCLPDVQRRLMMLARKLEDLPTVNRTRSPRKDPTP